MSNLKKKLVLVLVTGFLFANLSASAFASDFDPKSTLLPTNTAEWDTVAKCQSLMTAVKGAITPGSTAVTVAVAAEVAPGSGSGPAETIGPSVRIMRERGAGTANGKSFEYQDVLACGIKTGDIMMWMVPFYIRWILEFVIGLAGIASVGGFVVGGYFYLFAGISQDKEKGKNAIKNALIGLTLTLTAWAIVNIVISLVSS